MARNRNIVFVVCRGSRLLHRLEHAEDEYGEEYRRKCSKYVEVIIKPLRNDVDLDEVEVVITQALENHEVNR